MKLRQRRRRDERKPNVKDRGLSDRDLAVLEAVYHFRVMSQPQLQRYVFGEYKSPTVATRALASLFDRKYLDRRILPVREGRGPNYYVLDRLGAEALRRELGYTEVKFYPSYKQLTDGAVRHSLAVGDVRILITEACQRLNLDLDWISEVRMRSPGGYDRVTVNGETVGVIPDAVFCITNPQGTKSIFFLELDRGTMQPRRFRQKIVQYLAYVQQDSYFARFGHWLTERQLAQREARMRVLTIVSTDTTRADGGLRRLAYLRAEVEKVDGQMSITGRPHRRFWFARLDDLTAETVLSEPVWRVRTDEELNVLLWEYDPKNPHHTHA